MIVVCVWGGGCIEYFIFNNLYIIVNLCIIPNTVVLLVKQYFYTVV